MDLKQMRSAQQSSGQDAGSRRQKEEAMQAVKDDICMRLLTLENAELKEALLHFGGDWKTFTQSQTDMLQNGLNAMKKQDREYWEKLGQRMQDLEDSNQTVKDAMQQAAAGTVGRTLFMRRCRRIGTSSPATSKQRQTNLFLPRKRQCPSSTSRRNATGGHAAGAIPESASISPLRLLSYCLTLSSACSDDKKEGRHISTRKHLDNILFDKDTKGKSTLPQLTRRRKIGGTAYLVTGRYRTDAKEDIPSKLRRVILSRKFPA